MAHRTIAALLLLAFVAGSVNAQSLLKEFAGRKDLASTMVGGTQGRRPMGMAVVQSSNGALMSGDILVTNNQYTDSEIAGTGHTIVRISSIDGSSSNWKIFSEVPPGCGSSVGLTPAICTLPSGLIIVGSIPTVDGEYVQEQPGCLIVLNGEGDVVNTMSGSDIAGPWALACTQPPSTHGDQDPYVFVSTGLPNAAEQLDPGANGLNQTGSVVKLILGMSNSYTPYIKSTQYIAKDMFKSDIKGKHLGPGGLAVIDYNLYIVDTWGNAVFMSPGAAADDDVAVPPLQVCGVWGNNNGHHGASHKCENINMPGGAAVGPNGQLLIANSGDGKIIEVIGGRQTAVLDTLLPKYAQYGIAINQGTGTVYATNAADMNVVTLIKPDAEPVATGVAGRRLL